MFRNLFLASALALGMAFFATSSAKAQHFHGGGPSFQHGHSCWQTRCFDCRHEAYNFSWHKRRCGFETCVYRQGCHWIVRYRPRFSIGINPVPYNAGHLTGYLSNQFQLRYRR